jgi:hypothetical protein
MADGDISATLGITVSDRHVWMKGHLFCHSFELGKRVTEKEQAQNDGK